MPARLSGLLERAQTGSKQDWQEYLGEAIAQNDWVKKFGNVLSGGDTRRLWKADAGLTTMPAPQVARVRTQASRLLPFRD